MQENQQIIMSLSMDIPQELSAPTLSLVGVSGLDTRNNAVHKSIWETFSNNRRADRAPIQFRILGNAHEFPVIKPKRNSYDWYNPRGILKRNWMNKYLNEIPSVVVMFYDLDWNDPQWNEKMIECASRVQSMRVALEGRGTRLAGVLIQNNAPMPLGEDAFASDRAVNLCASCELTSNSLFVLPHGDHLQGYASRLEKAFYEFAQNFYQAEIKQVRSHKEHLNKNSHQYLLVRHQYKLGFLCELKQDLHAAHKHYTHAYNNLMEIRVVDTNALEVRTVAGFVNYKLCRLMFVLNLPRDAISQFKAHVDRFRNRVGFQELAFEHLGWLSKQYNVFGDIFDEAVKMGLPAVQTQHPGIYYQQAAQYAILRKRACHDLCAGVIAYPYPNPLVGASNMEFYGQRPWRPGKLTGEPPDLQLELNGIQALQYLEKQINHSNVVVSLYGLAISQYKMYRCPRTRRHLVLQMADEYFSSHDFGKTLTLLDHMLVDFRCEQWWVLLSDIIDKALRCAFLTANVKDYVLLGLEIVSKSSTLPMKQKRKVHDNINRILNKQNPIGDHGLSQDLEQSALIQWQPVFQSPNPVRIDLDLTKIKASVETRARFAKSQYEVDQLVTVEVYVRSTCPLTATFSQILLTITAPSMISSRYTVADGNDMTFNSGDVKMFTIDFLPDPSDVNRDLQIACVTLTMSTRPDCQFSLKYGSSNIMGHFVPELTHFKLCSGLDFDNIIPMASTLIVPRHSKLGLRLEHAIPALLGEWFEVKVDVTNKEDSAIKNMRAELTACGDDITAEFSTNCVPDRLPLILDLPTGLTPGEHTTSCFYIRTHKTVENNVEIKIYYNLDINDKPVASVKTENIIIPVVQPFEITTKFLSSLMIEVNKFYVGEEVAVMPTLRCLSPWPIIIEDTSFEFQSPFKNVENVVTSKLANSRLHDGEVGAELYLAVCQKPSEPNVTVGQYLVKWKRDGGLSTTSQLSIIGHPCEYIPLELKMTTPPHGLVRTPLMVTYHLHNRSHQLLQLDISMESSEAFMYAGFRQLSVSILPESVRSVHYNLYPLIAGSVILPKLVLNLPENGTEGPGLRGDQLKLLGERSLPTHLYVMPQVKGNPDIIARSVK